MLVGGNQSVKAADSQGPCGTVQEWWTCDRVIVVVALMRGKNKSSFGLVRSSNHADEQLFRQDQLVLFGATQAINLAVVLDPNFITTASQCFEANDLWQRFGVHVKWNRRWVLAIIRIWNIVRPGVHDSCAVLDYG